MSKPPWWAFWRKPEQLWRQVGPARLEGEPNLLDGTVLRVVIFDGIDGREAKSWSAEETHDA